jgi:uncharacterized SAM-binding protein YcdF (DUF218 family)
VRLVAVLGYSGRRHHGLHDVCAERLRHAEQVAAHGDTVLLSGWARHRNGTGEAELMREAWRGADVQLVSDGTARNTRENALGVATAAREFGAEEVVVVTSGWHARRARTLLQAADPTLSVRTWSPPGPWPLRLIARELVCLVALPYHLARLRRSRGKATST